MKLGGTVFATDSAVRPDTPAKACEERGFESVWFPEHPHIPTGLRTPPPIGTKAPRYLSHLYDLFVTLTAAAVVTKTIKKVALRLLAGEYAARLVKMSGLLGAQDYLLKPILLDDALHKVRRLLDHKHQAWELQLLRREITRHLDFESLVGRSAAMKALFALIQKVAPTTATVLITGESGVGKR